jgi:4-hydroxy-tetrahydrodipicolinate synthase
MKRLPKLQGVLTPNLTPMNTDGSLDLDSYARLSQTFLDAPAVDGLFAIGATGEYSTLNVAERTELIGVLGQLQRRGKVITANAGGLPTSDTLHLVEQIAKTGLDVAAVVLPTHVPDTNEAIVAFYREVDAVGLPFMVYQPVGFQTHKLSLELLQRLIELPNFVGLKDSSFNLMVFSEMCYRFGNTISVIQGVEMLQLPALACGSAGIVGGGANLYPGLLASLNKSFTAGYLDHARVLQHEINSAWEKISAAKNFRTWTKQIWQSKGVITTTASRVDQNPVLASPTVLAELLNLVDLGEAGNRKNN